MIVIGIVLLVSVVLLFVIKNRSRKNCFHFHPPNKTAVVIGAGPAGLCTAAVLARYFRNVTIVERDASEHIGKQDRKGIPQGTQVHQLLPFAVAAAEYLFPGFIEDSLARGATRLETNDVHYWYGHTKAAASNGPVVYSLGGSRAFWDKMLLHYIQALPNVIFKEAIVTGLVGTPAKISGIRIRSTDGAESVLEADWVMDASGRGSRVCGWLGEMLGGVSIPRETMNVHINYVAARFRCPVGAGMKSAYGLNGIANGPHLLEPSTAGALLICQENDEVALQLFSYGTKIPSEPSLIKIWMSENLRTPQPFLDVAETWECVQPWIAFTPGESYFRHFEGLAQWPDNFTVSGDAIAGFNPVFGQGILQAMRHALRLRTSMEGQRSATPYDGWGDVARQFQRAAAQESRRFWITAGGADLLQPTVTSKPLELRIGRFITRDLHWYLVQTPEGKACADQLKAGIIQISDILLKPNIIFPFILARLRTALIGAKTEKFAHAIVSLRAGDINSRT